ncbi:MAG: sensor domain-containing diguanylate cyclase [Pseudomonadota bacterium]
MNSPEEEGSYLEQQDMQDVLSRMPVAVAWASGPEGTIRFVNRKFTRMFGYTMDDLTTVHEWILKCYAVPEQASSIDNFWQDQIKSTGKPTEIEDIELDIICKDGSIKTVLSGKIVLPNQAGALSTFQDITHQKESELLSRKQAMEDPLTGLLNRRAFSQSLELALRRCREGCNMALMLIDLDGFKQVNDTLGHDRGDLLLRQVADRLRLAVRDQDVLCRIGGDEFCIVVNSINGEQTASIIADRVLFGLAMPYQLLGDDAKTGASIGIALYPDDGIDEQSLFKHADEALYRAKQGGKGRWCR